MFLAITEEQTHAIFDSLEHLRGFVIVVIILLLLWGMTALIGRIFMGAAARAKAAEAAKLAAAPAGPVLSAPLPAHTEPAPVSASAGEPTEEELAALAATVAMLLQGRHRILSVRPAGADWGREGRRQIFASHKIR